MQEFDSVLGCIEVDKQAASLCSSGRLCEGKRAVEIGQDATKVVQESHAGWGWSDTACVALEQHRSKRML
jgi:hypothetical protein